MSAQTGSIRPPAPASTGFAERARFRVRLWESEPNPIWVRELRQAARLTRTPVILTALSILTALLIASIGGIVATEASPATTGVVIHQVFFSLAYFVVTLLGPAVAANSIASEREGRTWEAVILTGLPPATIARGKFLSSFTSIALYIVMLAPVGALPFLFGGVTATEVVVAFLGLFLVALLGVAFGLAVSSKMASLRGAIVTTLLLAFPLSVAAFLAMGVGLSLAAHGAFPGVPEGPPLWLPTAWERAPFGVPYLVFLVVLPALSVVIPAWFLYEVTVANLTSITDDRGVGLKRWFLFSGPALALSVAIPLAAAGVPSVRGAVAAIGGLFVFFVACVFLFAGDPIGPSRRVKLGWERRGARALERFLGPGTMRSAALVLVVGVTCMAALAGLFCVIAGGAAPAPRHEVLAFAAYALAFFVFVVGLGAFLRARSSAPAVARTLLLAALLLVVVGPWVFAAIGGFVRDGFDGGLLAIGAPSPFYAFVMMDPPAGKREIVLGAGAAAMLVWATLGMVLLGAAARRCARVVQGHEALLAEGDRLLAAEDAAATSARQAASDPEAAPPSASSEPRGG